MIKELTDKSFDDFFRNGIACLVYYIDDSVLCSKALSTLDSIQIHFSNVKFAKINAENCICANIEFNIMVVPTVVLLKNGKVVEKIETLINKDDLAKKLSTIRGRYNP